MQALHRTVCTTSSDRWTLSGDPVRCRPPGIAAGFAVIAMLLVGCSGNGVQVPTVILDTPTGATPIYTPSAAMPGGQVSAPPGLQPGVPAQTSNVERSGSYTGTAEPLVTGGGICIETRKVAGFHVSGRSVRFGGYRGTIDAENSVQMVYGQSWVIGHFEGGTFHGQFDLPGRFGSPGCTYLLSLERTGP